MKHYAHSLAWYLYWLLALVLAFLAVSLLSVKILFEDIDSHRLEIQAFLSKELNATVHVGELKGSWQGWTPRLELKSLAIDGFKGQTGLSLAVIEADLALDPSATIKARGPVFSRFDFDGFTVRYDLSKADSEDDHKDQAEKPTTSHPASDAGAGLLTLLLQQTNINLKGSRIEVISKTGEEIAISPIHLQMQHDGVMHQLKVDAELATASGRADINFVAEVEGNPSQKAVDFYLSIKGLDHELLNPWLGLAEIELESFQASQQVWGQLHRGKLAYMTGKTSIENVKFQEYELEQFSLDTALLRRDKSYQLQITDINIAGEESAFNLPRISLDLKRDGNKIIPVMLMIDRLNLDQSQQWLVQQSYVPEKIVEIVKTLSPQGTVNNIQVYWEDGAPLEKFQLVADLADVGIDAWDDVPELKGIHGLLTADISGGKIHLQSSDFLMAYPTLFDYRWQYNQASGVIGWRFEDKGVVVASQLLNLKDDHVSASGRFSIYLPFSRDEQPLLNLQIGMQASEGMQAQYYIPPKEVGVSTYEWLVDAIKAGHINRAGFILNGVTRSRLPDYQLPAVQMFFDISDATFEYQSGWPEVSKADTFVFFRNGELVAEAAKGSLYDSKIGFTWVHLPKTTDKLFVAGNVSGAAADLHRLLTQSPLKEEVGDDLNTWKMSGQAETLVDLTIPLYTKKAPKVSVRSKTINAGFRSDEDRIDFSSINGVVTYNSRSGLAAKKLTASLFGQPVVAGITTAQKKTQVTINSSIEMDRLRKWLDLDLLRIASGKLNYQARLDMCPGKSCNQLVIESDLKGVEIVAPPPFAKELSQQGHLSVVSDLGRGYSDGRSAVRLNLGNELRGIMVNRDHVIERARFSLGGLRPAVPDKPGVWVDGELAYLDYEQLTSFLQSSGLIGDRSKADTEPGKAGEQENKLKHLKLKIGQFSFNDIDLQNFSVELTPKPDGWLLGATGPELAGNLWLPESDDEALKADLKYLKITSSDSDEERVDEADELSLDQSIEPTELPKLDFSVKSLILNDKPMGQWFFQLRPTETGALVENVRASMHGSVVKGELRWDKSGQEVSDLTLRLDSDNFGEVLKAWQVSDALETKGLKSYLQLSWEGAPWAFDIAATDGELQFTAKNGRLLDVGNSGNFLRVFGILNLQSLGRRLRLDFSDLFKSGMAFDQMTASYQIRKGVASTTEPFVMTGPSANLAMKGKLDLVNETVDKDMEVALPVTDNIPLVSVLLGAPQVAGAVFLFDKLIGDPLAKFATVKYHLSGDWGDPKIDLHENKDEKVKPEIQENNHG